MPTDSTWLCVLPHIHPRLYVTNPRGRREPGTLSHPPPQPLILFLETPASLDTDWAEATCPGRSPCPPTELSEESATTPGEWVLGGGGGSGTEPKLTGDWFPRKRRERQHILREQHVQRHWDTKPKANRPDPAEGEKGRTPSMGPRMTQEAREAAGPCTSPTCHHKEVGTGPKSTPARCWKFRQPRHLWTEAA